MRASLLLASCQHDVADSELERQEDEGCEPAAQHWLGPQSSSPRGAEGWPLTHLRPRCVPGPVLSLTKDRAADLPGGLRPKQSLTHSKVSRFSSVDHRKLNGAFPYHKANPLFSFRCTFPSRRNQGEPLKAAEECSEGQQDYGRVSHTGHHPRH